MSQRLLNIISKFTFFNVYNLPSHIQCCSQCYCKVRSGETSWWQMHCCAVQSHCTLVAFVCLFVALLHCLFVGLLVYLLLCCFVALYDLTLWTICQLIITWQPSAMRRNQLVAIAPASTVVQSWTGCYPVFSGPRTGYYLVFSGARTGHYPVFSGQRTGYYPVFSGYCPDLQTLLLGGRILELSWIAWFSLYLKVKVMPLMWIIQMQWCSYNCTLEPDNAIKILSYVGALGWALGPRSNLYLSQAGLAALGQGTWYLNVLDWIPSNLQSFSQKQLVALP